jgi:hypothetical protein
MSGGGFGSLLGLGASLIAPEVAPEIFGSGASLGTRLLANAALGGGIASLTGGNPFLGALAGGAGVGLKSLMTGPQAAYMGDTGAQATPGANVANATDLSGSSVANSPWTSQAVSATSPFGTAGTADMANMSASQLASVNPNITSQVLSNLGQQATPATPAVGVNPNVGTAPVQGDQTTNVPPSSATNFEDTIRKNQIAPVQSADTGSVPGTIKNGMYVSQDGNVYNTKDIIKAQNPSFFQQYKWPLLAGGAGLLALSSQRPKMPTFTQVSGPQFGLASNYQPLSNPTPVYPHFAEGGIAQLADGGSMMSQPANVNFMGNDMYPQSQQQTSFYATPTQMPISAQQTMASYEPKTNPLTGEPTAAMAHGGITSLADGGTAEAMQEAMANKWLSNLPDMTPTASAKGGMLDGPGDGMSDSIPGTIDGVRPARLADGEFVVPADVVSHLGNGSTKAGAKHLYKMLDRVRQARTGKKSQGSQINPAKFMPA